MAQLFKHVPADLPKAVPCPLAFVGEAPGDTEIIRGRVLVGPAGKRFDQMLRMAGIDRADHWCGNVFDEKLPDNDLSKWGQPEPTALRLPKGGYLREEHLWHFDRLKSELEAVQPALIIPMGATALWAFTGGVKITAARGAVSRATLVLPGAKILPTYHPQFVNYNIKAMGTVVADFRKALEEAARPAETLRLSPRRLLLDPSLEDIRAFVEALRPLPGPFALDIETAKGQITRLGVAADAETALSIPFSDFRKPDRNYWATKHEEVQAWRLVREILALPQPKLFQNGPYDVFYILRMGFRVNNWREDTRLLHHALAPEALKSLAYMGSVYAHLGPWKLLADHAKAKDEEKRDA